MKILAVLVALAGTASADPAAEAVAKKVQAFYGAQKHLTADFHQVVTPAFGSSKQKVSDGKLWAMKPTSARMDYLRAQKLYRRFNYDGTVMTYVDVSNLSIERFTGQNLTIPPAILFLTGSATLGKDFNLALDPSGKLELTPKQPSAALAKLQLVVDPKDGHVSESIVTGSSGDVEDVTFSNVDTATAVGASDFVVVLKNFPNYKVTTHP